MTTNRKPNRLAKEKSPYLLQHAYNPVDWFPWSEAAFEIAKQENKPIFLSIGYSTCHWCHVMAHESFDDEEVAAILNRDFISIKVDREERPDIDHLYMMVCQALTGQGGWPLTVIMTPDQKPFFAGTYYPKHRKYGRMGLMELLPQIVQKWQEDPEHVADTAIRIVEEVGERMLVHSEGSLSADILDKAYTQYAQAFDPDFGGFGQAPKFPSSHNLSFLMRYYERTGQEQALAIVEKTLDSMYRGGMYDHIGFGFSRYSVDERWLVPHFEKMLYDNALLAWTYLEAYQLTQKSAYAKVAAQIFTYVLRDMTHPEGGFYSAEDADSEGHEGKFYVWDPEEILQVLGAQEGELFCELYDITEEGNFEGFSIPNLIDMDLEQIASERQMDIADLKERIERSRKKLFAYREQRVHPGKDDKILTAWNGLMIMAMAKGYQTMGDETYLQAANRAVEFMKSNMIREDGRLLARYRDGEAAFPAYVDDYAFLVWGLIALFEASYDPKHLQLAIELNQQMVQLFWDDDKGGFYFYGNDSEQLLMRNKETYDGALPSGNSVALFILLKLAKLTSDAKLSQIAERQMAAMAGAIEQYPTGHAMALIALTYAYSPPSEIVIVGQKDSELTQQMLAAVRTRFRSYSDVILVPTGAEGERIRQLIPLVQDKQMIGSQATAYVCENFACQSPATELQEFHELLGK